MKNLNHSVRSVQSNEWAYPSLAVPVSRARKYTATFTARYGNNQEQSISKAPGLVSNDGIGGFSILRASALTHGMVSDALLAEFDGTIQYPSGRKKARREKAWGQKARVAQAEGLRTKPTQGRAWPVNRKPQNSLTVRRDGLKAPAPFKCGVGAFLCIAILLFLLSACVPCRCRLIVKKQVDKYPDETITRIFVTPGDGEWYEVFHKKKEAGQLTD